MAAIPLDVLKDLASPEEISEAELEVLSLALDGKSPTEIKTALGIQSENAVQKRLGNIYTKFRIVGAGPGKLHKLQKILTDRLQSKQGLKKVLVCWVDPAGRQIAEGMRDTIFKHPRIEVWSLDLEENLNSLWLEETQQLIEGADFGILCSTTESADDSKINLAVGVLWSRIQRFRLVGFGKQKQPESLPHTFLINAAEKDDLVKLLNEIIDGEMQEAKDWVNFRLSNSAWWETLLKEEESKAGKHEFESGNLVLEAGRKILQNNSSFQNNQVLRELITEFLTNVDEQIRALGSSGQVFSIPLELYPRYLVYLQKKFSPPPIVKAIAVIGNSVEGFWANDEGDEIGDTANKESERLFVFSDLDSFKRSTNFLLKHASKYHVFVTSLETYLPSASEFSAREYFAEWKEKDGLPTREYAVIKTSDNKNQMLAWYDEDCLKNRRSERFTNFSAIQNQVDLYEKAFDRIKKAQGVFPFSIEHLDVQEKVEDLDQLEKELFRRALPAKLRTPPEQLLEDLQKLRNELIRLENKDKIIQTALSKVRERLHSQVASIFLFGKDGRLQRRGLEGVDKEGRIIEKNWFSEESYNINESFIGRAAFPKEDSYGKPQLTNILGEEELSKNIKRNYSKKLGPLNCAIAVPLDGQSKTYGVLVVINKVTSDTGKPLQYCGFTSDEATWLSAIGSSVATALSNLRRDMQNKLYSDLNRFIFDSINENPKSICKKIAKRLISDETAFKVCIIRRLTDFETLEIEAIEGVEGDHNRVSMEKRDNNPRKPKDLISGKNPKFLTINKTTIDGFNNKEWIELNQLKSFALIPLFYGENLVGTLSLYTGYEYHFHDSCKDFLSRVASSIAAFMGRLTERQGLEKACSQLAKEPEQHIDMSKLNEEDKEKVQQLQNQMHVAFQELSSILIDPSEADSTNSSEAELEAPISMD